MRSKITPINAWAPLSPTGLICIPYMSWLARDAKARLLTDYERAVWPHTWPDFKKKGWRIIKVMVVPR